VAPLGKWRKARLAKGGVRVPVVGILLMPRLRYMARSWRCESEIAIVNRSDRVSHDAPLHPGPDAARCRLKTHTFGGGSPNPRPANVSTALHGQLLPANYLYCLPSSDHEVSLFICMSSFNPNQRRSPGGIGLVPFLATPT